MSMAFGRMKNPSGRASKKACLRCMVELRASQEAMKKFTDAPCIRHLPREVVGLDGLQTEEDGR